ncbi:MAG TPA: hemerythrin domain-containing protein [Burkholderiaceae bacterium]|nr:hemerythrin domain-containing protein [Burkholderiaceae bacterium]
MDTPIPTAQAGTAEHAAPMRRDLYAGIHKALRLFMTRTLCTIGATDPADGAAVQATLAMVERLLALCELHLKDENEFMHPALERARPGVSARIAAEHVHHAESIADLRDLAGLVADCQGAPRAAALGRLYRACALFVAENLQHMHVEETVHNPVLWGAYSDEELVALEHALVTSIPPQAMAEALHWFLPALHAGERAAMLGEMRQGMPPEPFRAVLEIARQTLDAAQHARLLRALDLPATA